MKTQVTDYVLVSGLTVQEFNKCAADTVKLGFTPNPNSALMTIRIGPLNDTQYIREFIKIIELPD